jgi:hypothetical protein
MGVYALLGCPPFLSVTVGHPNFEASINGICVLNQCLSRFASPVPPERVVMEINSTAPDWVCIVEVRIDAELLPRAD